MEIVQFNNGYADKARKVWNEVVRAGNAFPQENELTIGDAMKFFGTDQTYTGLALDNGDVVGLYILHPNNVGRCGHICNASYAVRGDMRGKSIGEALVLDCIEKAKNYGYRVLQFNAVVASNTPALQLYKKLGFQQLGVIPGGFRMPDGSYADIIPHYITL